MVRTWQGWECRFLMSNSFLHSVLLFSQMQGNLYFLKIISKSMLLRTFEYLVLITLELKKSVIRTKSGSTHIPNNPFTSNSVFFYT